MRILVADDEAAHLELIRLLLEGAGHQVIPALDGQEALSLYLERKPDVIILDFHMPRMTGLEVLKRIRREDAGTPAIMLSLGPINDAWVNAQKEGLNYFLGKPFDINVLLAYVSACRDRKEVKEPEVLS